MTLYAKSQRLIGSALSVAYLLLDDHIDMGTPEGRARARRRQVILAAIFSIIAKLVSVGTALLTVPLTLHYLGPEQYGMWLVLSSLVGILAFADLGIGNGLLNLVAAADGEGDFPKMRRVISSGFSSLLVTALIMFCAFSLAYNYFDLSFIFNVHTEAARSQANTSLFVFFLCFTLSMPATAVQRVQAGLQRGFLANIWQCIGSLLSLAAVVAAIALHAALPWLVAALLGGPLLANATNFVMFFYVQRPDVRPTLSLVDITTGLSVIRVGYMFLIIQLCITVCYSFDNLIIAQVLGVSSVPTYAVCERLFSTITMTAGMVLLPLWPAYRESIFRGDEDWARRILLKSLVIAPAYAAVLATALFVGSEWILSVWIGGAINPPRLLLVGFAVSKCLEVTGSAMAMYLNAKHIVGFQVATAVATAALSIVLEIILVHAAGITGAVWATLVAYLLLTLLPTMIYIMRDLGISPVGARWRIRWLHFLKSHTN